MARITGWVPNYHGAWAMITVPVLLGVAFAVPLWGAHRSWLSAKTIGLGEVAFSILLFITLV
ncbi:MAG: hypothetical protein GX483_03170 [Actinomycetaceae bacterium]|nr:hypothetical protein [Actinomycetaceae bacterium]